MDEEDIFRKLVFGVKFDTKRFRKDAERFHMVSSKTTHDDKVKKNPELNFFDKEKQSSNLNIKEIVPENNLKRKIDGECDTDNAKQTKTDGELKNPRKSHRIYVEGADIPELVMSFEKLKSVYKFSEVCTENITKKMGFKNLTPIQMQAIPAMMHGREILACAPTGSGKTLAFLIPVVAHLLAKPKKKQKGFRGLILSPTRELADQTYRECKQLLLNSVEGESIQKKQLLNVKVLDKNESKTFTNAGEKHSKKMDLLISTPNKIVYLLQHDPPLIRLDDIEWLVVDESDKLFEEGKSGAGFREQLGTIYAACTNPQIRRAMFSATFAYDVQQWCLLNMDNVLQITIGGRNTAVESVDQELKFVGNEHGKLLTLRQIMQRGFTPPVLIFVQSKERAKELFAELIYDGKNVDAIHADRTPMQRENAVKCFRTGGTWILICTELMGRGMDFKGVNLVINYDFPSSAICYIHRIGRTGRAGRTGKAITFFTDDDKPLLRNIANVIRQAGCAVPEFMLQMKKMPKKDVKQASSHEIKRSTIRSAPAHILKPKKKLKESKNSKPVSDHKKTDASK